jgi:hypothetical protein
MLSPPMGPRLAPLVKQSTQPKSPTVLRVALEEVDDIAEREQLFQ